MALAAPTLGSEQVDTTSAAWESASWTPAADDLVLTFSSARASSGGTITIGDPTDDDSNTYTEILETATHYWQGGSSFAAKGQVARTIVDGTPTATVTDFDYGGTSSIVRVMSHVVRVAGHDTSTPIESSGSVTGDPNGGTIGACDVGTLVTGNLVIVSLFAAKSSAPSLSAPTLGGEAMTQLGTQVGSGFNYQECWYRIVTGDETDGEVDMSDWDGCRNAHIMGVQIAEAGGGGVTVDGNLLTETPTLHNPTVTVGGVTGVAELLSSAPSLFNPTVSTSGGPQDVTGNLLTNAPTLYNPTVSAGEVTAVANLLTNEITLYQPSATVGSVTPLAEFIASTLSMHEPTVSTITGLEADLLTSAPTMFLPSAVPGGVLVEMVQIVNPTQVHNPTVFDPAEGAPDEDFTTYNKSRLYIVNRTLPLYGAKTGGWME